MNKIYKVIWSKAKHCYIVASEIAKSHTKSSSTGGMKKLLLATLAAATLSCTGFVGVSATDATIKVDTSVSGGTEVYTKDGADGNFATYGYVKGYASTEAGKAALKTALDDTYASVSDVKTLQDVVGASESAGLQAKVKDLETTVNSDESGLSTKASQADLTALKTIVSGDSTSGTTGLVGSVADLQKTVGNDTDGLVADVAALQKQTANLALDGSTLENMTKVAATDVEATKVKVTGNITDGTEGNSVTVADLVKTKTNTTKITYEDSTTKVDGALSAGSISTTGGLTVTEGATFNADATVNGKTTTKELEVTSGTISDGNSHSVTVENLQTAVTQATKAADATQAISYSTDGTQIGSVTISGDAIKGVKSIASDENGLTINGTKFSSNGVLSDVTKITSKAGDGLTINGTKFGSDGALSDIKSITTTGDAKIGGKTTTDSLEVTNASTFKGAATFESDVTIKGSLKGSGSDSTTVNEIITNLGNTKGITRDDASTTKIEGKVTIDAEGNVGNVKALSAETITTTGAANIGGAANVTGALDVTGKGTFKGGIEVTNGTKTDTLTVTGTLSDGGSNSTTLSDIVDSMKQTETNETDIATLKGKATEISYASGSGTTVSGVTMSNGAISGVTTITGVSGNAVGINGASFGPNGVVTGIASINGTTLGTNTSGGNYYKSSDSIWNSISKVDSQVNKNTSAIGTVNVDGKVIKNSNTYTVSQNLEALDTKIGEINSTGMTYVTDGNTISANLTVLDTNLKAAKDATQAISYDSSSKTTTVSDNLTVNGATNLKNTNVGGTLEVTGTSTFGGKATFTAGLDANNQKITGVGAGTIEESSTDAVNGGQVHGIKTALEETDTKLGNKIGTVSSGTYIQASTDGSGTDSKASVADNLQSLDTALGGVDDRTDGISRTDTTTKIEGKVTIDADGNVGGVNILNATDVKTGTITTTGAANIGGNLDVTGLGTFRGGIAVSGSTKTDTLEVTGNATFKGNLTDGSYTTTIESLAKTQGNTEGVTRNTDDTTTTIEGNVTIDKDGKVIGKSFGIKDTAIKIDNSGINAGGQKITGVANGEISSTSTDAVNGSQLHDIKANVIGTVTDGNDVSATKNVAQNLNALDTHLNTVSGKVSANETNIQTLKTKTNQFSDDGKSLTGMTGVETTNLQVSNMISDGSGNSTTVKNIADSITQTATNKTDIAALQEKTTGIAYSETDSSTTVGSVKVKDGKLSGVTSINSDDGGLTINSTKFDSNGQLSGVTSINGLAIGADGSIDGTTLGTNNGGNYYDADDSIWTGISNVDGQVKTNALAIDTIEKGNALGNGNYVKKDNTVGKNLEALDRAIDKVDTDGNVIRKSGTNTVSDNLVALDTKIGQIDDTATTYVKNDYTISKNLTELDEKTQTNTTAIGGHETAIDALQVATGGISRSGTTTTIEGKVTIDKDGNVGGVNILNATDVKTGTITTTGAANIGGNLDVTGLGTFRGGIAVSGGTKTDTLEVTGNATFEGELTDGTNSVTVEKLATAVTQAGAAKDAIGEYDMTDGGSHAYIDRSSSLSANVQTLDKALAGVDERVGTIAVTETVQNIDAGATVSDNLLNLDKAIGETTTGNYVNESKSVGANLNALDTGLAAVKQAADDAQTDATKANTGVGELKTALYGEGQASDNPAPTSIAGRLGQAEKDIDTLEGTSAAQDTRIQNVEQKTTGIEYSINDGTKVSGVIMNHGSITLGQDGTINGMKIGAVTAGTYVNADQSLGTNLNALDTAIGKVTSGTYVSGTDTVAGNLQSLDTHVVANEKAIQKETEEREKAIGTIDAAKSHVYVDATNSVSQNLQALDEQTYANAQAITGSEEKIGDLQAKTEGIERVKTGDATYNTVIKDKLVANEDATFKKDVTVAGTTTTKTLKVEENATIGGTLEVTGTSTFKDKATFENGVQIDGTITDGDGHTTSVESIQNTQTNTAGIVRDTSTSTTTTTIEGMVKIDSNGKITGVADGKVEAGSTDAVNGGQLYTEQEARKTEDAKLDKRIGSVADGNYIKASTDGTNAGASVADNLKALDTAIGKVTANGYAIKAQDDNGAATTISQNLKNLDEGLEKTNERVEGIERDSGGTTIESKVTIDSEGNMSGVKELSAESIVMKHEETETGDNTKYDSYTHITADGITNSAKVTDTVGGVTTESTFQHNEQGSSTYAYNGKEGDWTSTTSAVTSDGVANEMTDSDKNKHTYTQTSTGTSETIKDNDGNKFTSKQTATGTTTKVTDGETTSVSKMDADKIVNKILDDNGKELAKVKLGDDGNVTIKATDTLTNKVIGEDGKKTTTEMTTTDITNTATDGTIKNTAKEIINESKGNTTNIVGGDLTTTVEGKTTENYKGGLTTTVTGDEEHTVTGKQTNNITGNQENIITGNQTTTVTGDIKNSAVNITNEASANMTNSAKELINKATEKLLNKVEVEGAVVASTEMDKDGNLTNEATNTLTNQVKVGEEVMAETTMDKAGNVKTTAKTSVSTEVGNTSLKLEDGAITERITEGTDDQNTSTSTATESHRFMTNGTQVSTTMQKADGIGTIVKDTGINISTSTEQTAKDITLTAKDGTIENDAKSLENNATETIKNTAGTSITDQVGENTRVLDEDGITDTVGNTSIKQRVNAIVMGYENGDTKSTVQINEYSVDTTAKTINNKAEDIKNEASGMISSSANEITNTAAELISNKVGENTIQEITDGQISSTVKDAEDNENTTEITSTGTASVIRDADGNVNGMTSDATMTEHSITDGNNVNTVISTVDGVTFTNGPVADGARAIDDGDTDGLQANTVIKGNEITTSKITMDFADVLKDLGVHGDATIAGKTTTGSLSVENDAEVGGNLTVKKDLQVEGKASLKDTDIDGTLNVSKKATFQDSVDIAKDLAVSGKTTSGSFQVAGTGIVLDENGLDMDGRTITGIANGEISASSTDVVNGRQLYGVKRDLETKIDKVGANAAAMANLRPLDYDGESKWSLSGAIGNYGSETAAALGVFYRPNEDVSFNLSTTMGTGENMYGGGVSIRLGKGGGKRVSRAENEALKAQVESLTARMDALLSVLNPNMSQDFPDVPENHWAYEAVSRLAGNGIVEGYPDGEFHGERTMSRYEMAEIIYNALSQGAQAEQDLVEEFKPELQAMAASQKVSASNAAPAAKASAAEAPVAEAPAAEAGNEG